ncbi:MAG: hypothetical protein RL007_2320 [Bacteroidota bacterium]|jgi:hypothetical protein
MIQYFNYRELVKCLAEVAIHSTGNVDLMQKKSAHKHHH